MASLEDFPVPPTGVPMQAYWRNGAMYTWARSTLIEKDKDGAEFSRIPLAMWQDAKWSLLVYVKVPPKGAIAACPPIDHGMDDLRKNIKPRMVQSG